MNLKFRVKKFLVANFFLEPEIFFETGLDRDSLTLSLLIRSQRPGSAAGDRPGPVVRPDVNIVVLNMSVCRYVMVVV